MKTKNILTLIICTVLILMAVTFFSRSQRPPVTYEELLQMSDTECYDKLVEIGFKDPGCYADKETAGKAFKDLITEIGKEDGFIPNYLDQDYMHEVFVLMKERHISFPVIGKQNKYVYEDMLNLDPDGSK